MNDLEILAIVLGGILLIVFAFIIGIIFGYSHGVRDMVELYKDSHKNLWTPIEAGLPEEDVRVIVAVHYDNSYTQIDTDRILHGQWVRWEGSITHWTELPELPNESEDTE